jgi:pimeloyl-ACP methyl ester carboxylesterase
MQITANGIRIECDVQGPESGEPLMLIMGLGMQLVAWPQELVGLLVARGYRVIRFDNRDIGLSQHFDDAGMPNMAWVTMRHLMHLPVHSAYSLADMADDAAGVLRALGITSAHVCGASMGGMIAQHLAVKHAARVKSLTLMMTTTGSRKLPMPDARVLRALMRRPMGPDLAAAATHFEGLLNVIGSPGYPSDPAQLRPRLMATVRRSYHPAGSIRQLVAITADGDRSAWVPRISAPTHVIHGLADPLVPVASGEELARLIPGATLDLVPGMGHDLPLQLLGRFADGMDANAKRAGAVAARSAA